MTLVIDPDRDMLGLIDVQPTFMPGGELPVADGDAVVPVINRLLAGPFRHAFATQDWHPPGHVSFASRHGLAPFATVHLADGPQALWPDHALRASAGAALHPDLDLTRVDVVVRKGVHPDIDSYSAFMENDRRTPTGLGGFLRERGVARLFLTGLAADVCVAWSAEDAVRMGFAVVMLEDATRGVALPDPAGGTTMTAARRRLEAMGVRFARSEDVA
jgi:nicotinamidase/pyrazinamidase